MGGLWDELTQPEDTPPEAAKTSLWDELSKGMEVGSHASELAKHRWETLKAAGEANTYPAFDMNVPYRGEANLLGDLNRPVTPVQQNSSMGNVLPTMPTIQPVAKGEAPTWERLARNTAIGAANLPSNTANFFTGLINHPQESAAGLLEQAKAFGKAGLWASVVGMNPTLANQMSAAGLGPQEFNEMFQNDPVGTSLMVVGGVEGLRRGLKSGGPEQPPTPGAPPTPPVIEPPVYKPTPFEQALAALKQQLGEGGAPGRSGVVDVGEGGTVNPKDVVSSATNSPKGSGTHTIQAAQAEYQLVRPDLTKKQIKAAWTSDKEAVLREIAYARAKDAITNSQQGFASEDIPATLNSRTAEGLGVDPTVPINRPLDSFDNSRLQEMRAARKTVEEFHQNRIAKATVEKLAPAIASNDGAGAVASGMRTEATADSPPHLIKDAVDTVMSALGDKARADLFSQAEIVESLSKHINDIIDAAVMAKRGGFGFTPAMDYVRKVANHIYEHAKGDISSSSFARFQHIAYAKKLVHNVLNEGLEGYAPGARRTELTKRLNFFGQIMMDDASKAVDLKNQNITALQREWKDATVAGDKPRADVAKAKLGSLGAKPDTVLKQNLLPKMTEAELAEEKANPVYQKAVDFHKNNLQVELESRASGAGVESRLYGPRGTYMPLKRYESLSEAPKGTKTVYAPGEGGAPGPMDYAHTKTRAAKGRTGAIPEGMFVSMDYMEHALDGRVARFRSFYRRQLQEAIIKEDLTLPNGTHPDTIAMPDGKTSKVVKVQILDFKDGKLLAEPWVPKPMADAYHLATHKPWSEDKVVLGKLMQGYTNAALVLMPAEATMHTLNVVSVLAAADKVGAFSKGGSAAQWVPVLGKFAGAMKRIADQSGQHLADNMDVLAQHGGLRTGGFKSMGTTAEAVGAEMRGKSLNPKDWLFGYPDHATPALESRLRSALLDVIREGEPGISDADAVRRVNTIAGTYVTKLAPSMSKVLAPFYPFAKATTALGRTGVQVATGFDPATGKWSAKAFAQNVAAPAFAGLLLGKMLDDRGRWGWEIPGAKALDIVFSRNGTTYHIPARLYMQLVYRGLNLTGVRSAINQYVADEGDNAFKRIPSAATMEDVGMAWKRGVGNYIANLTSPAIKAGEVMLFGHIPYQFPNGDFLDLDHHDMQHPLWSSIKATATTAVAPVQKIEEKGGNRLPTQLGRRLNRAANVVGLGITAEPTSKEHAITASGNKAFQENVDDLIGKIISESRNEDSPQAYAIEQVRKRLPKTGVIIVHGKPTPIQVYAIQEALRRSLPPTKPGTPPELKENLRLAR